MKYLKKKPILSICIPTFNRANNLLNCLTSINTSLKNSYHEVEICISDNCSTDKTADIVKNFNSLAKVKYNLNKSNLGFAQNFLKVVSMSSGKYAWLLGDDDLLMPSSIRNLLKLIKENQDVDFFFVNAFHLNNNFVMSYPQPFSTVNLPTSMEPFSKMKGSKKLPFLDLVNPSVSFDFLGGMFLSVFKRDMWDINKDCLSNEAIKDKKLFSHFDNTFPHVKIFAKSFSHSMAYFNEKPLVVCLEGVREWAPLESMIKCIRLIESTKIFRKEGLEFFKYIRCRNYALRNFWSHLIWMLLNYKISGLEYLSFKKHILPNIFFPNFYFSPFYYIFRKLFNMLTFFIWKFK